MSARLFGFIIIVMIFVGFGCLHKGFLHKGFIDACLMFSGKNEAFCSDIYTGRLTNNQLR